MRLLCFFLLITPIVSRAQFTYTLNQSIPVHNLDGDPWKMPWAGGLNAAQFNTMDLNGDGTDDLVLYDRMANKVITFLALDNQYVPAPDFEALFPKDIYNWVLLRDFNCDGKKDLFTGDVLGVKVFINTSDGSLTWERYLFTTGFPGSKSQVLLTENPATEIKVNLQLQYDDLPSISDLDGDGDLDILNIQYAGHTVEFHQNLSMENYQSCDSLEFVRVTRSWGSFRECDCGSFAFNDAPCPPSAGRTKHAGGKSLLALNINGDQEPDLLFSEAECTQLFALPNKGTAAAPVIDNFLSFPPGRPVNFVLFPAPFYEDVDFDGKKDLIATPNIFSKEFLNSQLNKSTWFYRNTGSDAAPAFTFVQDNFLQGEMIDIGDNAVPAFADYNGDGLFDMLVSTHSSDKFTSRLYLFENTGSATSPTFKLMSDDYLGFTTSRYYNVKIQFADMDNNDTPDLTFTATSFDNGVTNLYYLPNKSRSSLDFSGQNLRKLEFELTMTENVYLVDLSGDGLPDIITGRSEGNIEYWRNTGTSGNPVFTLDDEYFLGFNTSPLRQNLAVAVADLDGDGNRDLVIGDQRGRIGVVSNFRSVSDGQSATVYDVVFNALSETYEERNLGGRVWPVVVNLFGADKPALVIGNSLGGLHVLSHDNGVSLAGSPQVSVYPNPVLSQDVVNIVSDRHVIMEVYTILGQRVGAPIAVGANEVHQYELSNLAAGLYLLKFSASKKSFAQRLIVR